MTFEKCAFSLSSTQRMDIRKANLDGCDEYILSGRNVRRAEFVDLRNLRRVIFLQKWPAALEHPPTLVEVRRATVPETFVTYSWIHRLTALTLFQCHLPEHICVPTNMTLLTLEGSRVETSLSISAKGPTAHRLEVSFKHMAFDEPYSKLDVCGGSDIIPSFILFHSVLMPHKLFVSANSVELDKCDMTSLNLQDFWVTSTIAVKYPLNLSEITDTVDHGNVHGPPLEKLFITKLADMKIALDDLQGNVPVFIIECDQSVYSTRTII
jgi:hypothetical protein